MNLISMCRKASFIGLPALLALTACSNDNEWKDVDGGTPALSLTTTHERTEAGRSIKIAGKVTDNDGIASIDLVCHDIKLNKHINLIEIYGEPLKEYDLDYAFKIQEDQAGEDFNVEITITDIGGRKEKQNLRVTLDADWSAPYFTTSPDAEVIVLIKEKTSFNLKFSVADNRVVDYVDIDVVDITDGEEAPKPVEGYPRRVEGNGTGKLDFSEKLTLPSKEATLRATVTAYDREANEAAHSATFSSLVKVQELQDMEKMWLCDVTNEDDLSSDIFGVPVLCDHIGPYKYQIRYYNEKAGTEVSLLGQKGSFGPLCFAPSKDNPSVLGDNPDEVNWIKLTQANTYYLITFDTFNGTYSTETYSVDDAIDPVMHMHFGGDDLNTWWDWNNEPWWQEFYFGPMSDGPRDVTKMTKDAKNPHIYILEDWKLSKGDKLHFVIHNWHHDGWWNLATWRVDDSADPGKFMYYGNLHPDNDHYTGNADYFQWKYGDQVDLDKWGDESYRKQFVPDNWVNMESIERGGTFKLIFDAHTERAKLIPQN
ncbi:MAG: hypothetical protein K2L45_03360 [Muribaculaceae bacterium]|nr:hypothetical protein [Muribaculaceae bacterium]